MPKAQTPYLTSAGGGIVTLSPPWFWELHRPPLNWKGFILYLILEGKVIFSNSKSSWTAEPGNVFYMPAAQENYTAAGPVDREVRLIWLNFAYYSSISRPAFRLCRFSNHFFVEQLFLRVISSGYEKKKEVSSAWLNVLLTEILQQKRRGNAPCRKIDYHFDQIQKLCAQIRSQPGHPWRTLEMASKTGLSKGHFARLFRHFTGQSPIDYVLRSRIDEAQNLLTKSTLPIKEIATKLGYYDEFAFSKQFKSRLKQNPSDLRRNGC